MKHQSERAIVGALPTNARTPRPWWTLVAHGVIQGTGKLWRLVNCI